MRSRFILLISLAIISGCLDPYSPHVKPADVNLLVVDGSLDTSDGTAAIALSRGVALSMPDSFPPVNNAYVAVEDALGNIFPLAAGDSGNYRATGIPVYADARYRLHVVTSNDDEYYSDFVSSSDTPEIDSVTWTTDDRKLTIRVNTHDPSNQSQYYRWTFVETWNYHASLLSLYIYDYTMAQFRGRNPDEMVYYCWNTAPSENIVIGSTARLSQAIVSQVPIQYIAVGSRKLQMRYSILVTQRAISETEYTYLDQLRKTTESIGGLFDPQPAPVTGNMHASSSSSPTAVGYFGAGHTTKMRLYIDAAGLPRPFREIYPLLGCIPPDTVTSLNDLNPTQIVGVAGANGGFTITNERCGDCRWEGGVTTMPPFWE